MPSTIKKNLEFRIKHTTLLEGETVLRNKHKIAFFEIKCTFFDRKENTISKHYHLCHACLHFQKLVHMPVHRICMIGCLTREFVMQ